MTRLIDGSAPAVAHVVYDVETVGILGPCWAVGWVALDAAGNEIDAGHAWTEPAGDPAAVAWARPARDALAAESAPLADADAVLRVLWAVWLTAKTSGAQLWCDVAYPCDAPTLAAAHRLAVAEGVSGPFDGPFPLGDIAQRLGGRVSGPPLPADGHHPVVDARWSSGRLRDALGL